MEIVEIEAIAELRRILEIEENQYRQLYTSYRILEEIIFGLSLKYQFVDIRITLSVLGTSLYRARNCSAPESGWDLLRLHELRMEHQLSRFAKRMRKTAKMWGFVYLIHAPILDLYKIGFSKAPDDRAKDLSQSLPKEMRSTVVHSIMTDDMKSLEGWFHVTLTSFRHDREWFKLNDVQVAEIKSIESFFLQI